MDAFAKLGIDLWSIVVYMANAGLLILVLVYLLYKPLFRFTDERRKRIADGVHAADRLREDMEQRLKQSEEAKAKIEAELRQEMLNLTKFTEEKRTELLEEMNLARASMLEKAQADIDLRKEQIFKEVEKEVKVLMSRIILDVVRHKVPEDVVRESVTDAWKHQISQHKSS